MTPKDQLELFSTMQRSEATLHWSRNSYFLVASSILLIAVSQLEIPVLKFSVGLLGLAVNIVWVLIQHRSSQYLLYWKTEAQNLSVALKLPSLYPPSVKGLEMRKVAYLLPLPFLFVWLVVMGVALAG